MQPHARATIGRATILPEGSVISALLARGAGTHHFRNSPTGRHRDQWKRCGCFRAGMGRRERQGAGGKDASGSLSPGEPIEELSEQAPRVLEVLERAVEGG